MHRRFLSVRLFLIGAVACCACVAPPSLPTHLDCSATVYARDAASHGPLVARDWKQFPAVVRLDASRDIVAVGDVHGDYKRLRKLLGACGLIESQADSHGGVRWTGGTTILVCTGDLIDKGDESLDVIACFRLLQKQALASGGRVIVTMGNHEAEFLANAEDDEKAEQFLKELDSAGLDASDVASGTDHEGIGEFLRSLPFAAKINDWFFAHACNTKGMTLDTLDRELQDSVAADGFAADILVGKSGLLEARLKPLPWWERRGDAPEDSFHRLKCFADALGIRHFVMGHQPGKAFFSDGTKRKRGELIQRFHGLIFLIDVGMSRAVDYSHGAVLKIQGRDGQEKCTVIDSDGNSSLIWTLRKVTP